VEARHEDNRTDEDGSDDTDKDCTSRDILGGACKRVRLTRDQIDTRLHRGVDQFQRDHQGDAQEDGDPLGGGKTQEGS